MFPARNPQSLLGIFVILVIVVFHMSHVASSKIEQAQDETVMENNDASPARVMEDSEINTLASDTIEKRKKLRISCRCWIGWRGKEGRKCHYFGIIRKFIWYKTKKQQRCSASCSNKCAPYLIKTKKNYNYLCKKIGKKYYYKKNKVGCFSKVGKFDTHNNLWDFDGAPHKLCCKMFRKSCQKKYGFNFIWHSGLKLCAKNLHSGCIPGVPNGTKKPDVCCIHNKLYACQKAEYVARSVKCW